MNGSDWSNPDQSGLDRSRPKPVRSGLRSHTVVGSAGHDVSSPADASEGAVSVHAASVDTGEVHAGAVLTLVSICNTNKSFRQAAACVQQVS